jgi:hypothetical protein
MHTRVLFRVNASKGVSKINIWHDLNGCFGSVAAAQTISFERLLSGAYQPLANGFSKVTTLVSAST